jgi:hypothetical protein
MPGFTGPRPDEREQLLAFLAQQRYVLRLASHGLNDEQARLSPSASSLSVGGIIKHVSRTEAFWIDVVMNRQAPFDATASRDNHAEGFRLGPDETLQGVLDSYEAVARTTQEVVRSLPVDHPVPVPSGVPWFPADVESWSLRWVLLHLIEETARHAGHADIVRESIDGGTWLPLMAAAEDWAPTPHVQPWQAPEAQPTTPARTVRLASVTLDCPDPKALASFYSRFLGTEVALDEEQWAAVKLGRGWLSFQRVEDYRRPTWPSGETPQQSHLDFVVADLDVAENAALAAGATKAAVQPSPQRWRVMVDPVGHPFCVSLMLSD